jgi:hypothetical protein
MGGVAGAGLFRQGRLQLVVVNQQPTLACVCWMFWIEKLTEVLELFPFKDPDAIPAPKALRLPAHLHWDIMLVSTGSCLESCQLGEVSTAPVDLDDLHTDWAPCIHPAYRWLGPYVEEAYPSSAGTTGSSSAVTPKLLAWAQGLLGR